MGDALGGTDKQHALRTKRVTECSEDPALRDVVEINQQIAAADQVQSRERRITRHILTREETEIADVLRNSVLAVVPDEKAREAFRRHLVQSIDRVDAGARLLQRRLADISAENLDLQRRRAFTQVFENRDGDGIDLLRSEERRVGKES